eukprot:g1827.t1
MPESPLSPASPFGGGDSPGSPKSPIPDLPSQSRLRSPLGSGGGAGVGGGDDSLFGGGGGGGGGDDADDEDDLRGGASKQEAAIGRRKTATFSTMRGMDPADAELQPKEYWFEWNHEFRDAKLKEVRSWQREAKGILALPAHSKLRSFLEFDSLVLTDVSLVDQGIGDSGAALVAKYLTFERISLTTCSLRRCKVGLPGARVLAEALKVNRTVTSLDLGDNYIFPRGLGALSHALYENDTLTALDLSGCMLVGQTTSRYGHADHGGVSALSEFLRYAYNPNSLTALNLRNTGLRQRDVLELARGLDANRALTGLNLRDNRIGAAGMLNLLRSVREHETLAALNISGVDIVEGGSLAAMGQLVMVIQDNETLQHLDISGNGIAEDALSNLADALYMNSALRSLSVRGNDVDLDLQRRFKENSSFTLQNLVFE